MEVLRRKRVLNKAPRLILRPAVGKPTPAEHYRHHFKKVLFVL